LRYLIKIFDSIEFLTKVERILGERVVSFVVFVVFLVFVVFFIIFDLRRI